MADKIYNLMLPDGTSLTVPAWATEETLSQLTESLKQSNIIDNSILSKISDIKVDSDNLQSALNDYYESVQKTKRVGEEQAEAIQQSTESVARGIAGAVDSLANTEKPLSKMVEYAESGLKGVGSGLGRASENLKKKFDIGGNQMSVLGDVLGGVTTAGAAYAGFVAGQIEQLAAAQKTMIDSGAIFRDASDIGSLVGRVKQTGITYTKLSEIVSQYTRGIAYVGDTTSEGAKTFVDRFENVMVDLEEFGDFGFSVDEIADAYAAYLETARLRQITDTTLANNSSALDMGFQNLLAESSALSTLTKESRGNILSRIVDAFQDSTLTAGLARMQERDPVLTKTLEEATKMFQTRATEDVERASGGLFSVLQTGLNQAVKNYAGRPEDFEITSFLREVDPVFVTALQKTGVLTSIEEALQSNNIPALKKAIDKDLPDAIKNMDLFTQGQTPAIKRLIDMGEAMVSFTQQFGALMEADQKEIDQIIKDTEKAMADNAAGVAALNNLKTEFLQVQEAITPNLQDASKVVRKFTSTLSSATDIIQKVTGVEYSTFMIDQQLNDPERINRIEQAIANNEELTAEDRELLEDMAISVKRQERSFLGIMTSSIVAGTAIGTGVGMTALGAGAAPGAVLGAVGGTIGGLLNYFGAGDLLEDATNISVSDGSSIKSSIMGSDPEEIMKRYKELGIEQREMGGPVQAGKPYVVGEKGPELMVPDNSGTIVPNNLMNQISPSASGENIEELLQSKRQTLQTMKNLQRVVEQMVQNSKTQRAVKNYS